MQNGSKEKQSIWKRLREVSHVVDVQRARSGTGGRSKPMPVEQPPPFDIAPEVLHSPTSIVHVEYDPETLEAVPSPEWTRFVCISDTHSRSFEVPDGDVLLHSGDLTNTGTLSDFKKTMEWLYELPHKVKIIIAGNHDLTLHTGWYEKSYSRWHRNGKESVAPIMELLKGKRAVAAGLVYIQDEEYDFQVKEGGRTWSVYGSPWSPYFFDWAFNYKREDGKELVSKFPKTDILLTHGPASGIFDRTRNGDLVGCEDLRARLPELRPRLHLAGHIHEAHGAHIHDWIADQSGKFEPPIIQNDNSDGSEDEVGNKESLTNSPVDATPSSRDIDRTVFVNAANWPAGKKAWRARPPDTGGQRKSPFGGPGFQPVVVDLKD